MNKILESFLNTALEGTGSSGKTSTAALNKFCSAKLINSSKSKTSALLTKITELSFSINFNLSLLIKPSFSFVTPASIKIN